jgi:hypothetical protein
LFSCLCIVRSWYVHAICFVSCLFVILCCIVLGLVFVVVLCSLCCFPLWVFVCFVCSLCSSPCFSSFPGFSSFIFGVVLFMSYVFPCGLSLCLFVLDLSSVSLFVC